jgi:hypothetical protein
VKSAAAPPENGESSLSKAVTIIALTSFLVLGTAATAILARESIPDAGASVQPALAAVVSNWENKADRLTIASIAPEPAAAEPTGAIAPEPLRQSMAYAPAEAEATEAFKDVSKDASKAEVDPAQAVQKPKPVAAKPPAQKSYTLLSEAQIAGIRERLKLSPDQEYYWPAVENALRAVARRLHATRQTDPNTPVKIDPEAAEVQQLKSAAMPLLFQLREDQKREVRQLARLIGLEKVAAMI